MVQARVIAMTLLAGLPTAGCSSLEAYVAEQNRVPPPDVVAPDPIELRLAEAAEDAARALDTLARIERVRTPPPPMDSAPDAPPELQRLVSIDWTGPIEPLAARIAERAGYAFSTVGAAPSIPLIVRLAVEQRTVIDLLRSLSLQLGNRASIVLDANRRVVELRYETRPGG